jgi:energy-coupling factor transporter ATP-binding protein EcfA2
VLVRHGPPGSGKTTLSRAIAEVLRKADAPHAVIDLDDLSNVFPHPRRSFARENLLATPAAPPRRQQCPRPAGPGPPARLVVKRRKEGRHLAPASATSRSLDSSCRVDGEAWPQQVAGGRDSPSGVRSAEPSCRPWRIASVGRLLHDETSQREQITMPPTARSSAPLAASKLKRWAPSRRALMQLGPQLEVAPGIDGAPHC